MSSDLAIKKVVDLLVCKYSQPFECLPQEGVDRWLHFRGTDYDFKFSVSMLNSDVVGQIGCRISNFLEVNRSEILPDNEYVFDQSGSIISKTRNPAKSKCLSVPDLLVVAEVKLYNYSSLSHDDIDESLNLLFIACKKMSSTNAAVAYASEELKSYWGFLRQSSTESEKEKYRSLMFSRFDVLSRKLSCL